MQQRYIGLTLGQVYENRERYGANVANPPATENWIEKIELVSSFWLIKVVNLLALLCVFMLPLLDLLDVPMQESVWSVLIIMPLVLLYVYLIVLLSGHVESKSSRYEVVPIVIVLLVCLLISVSITYYHNLYVSIVDWSSYWNSIALAILVFLLSLILFIIDVRHRHQVHRLDIEQDLAKCCVIRDGVAQYIPRKDVVVGDLICLEIGSQVPADAELLECNSLVVNEYDVTGIAMSLKSVDSAYYDYAAAVPSNHVLRGSTIIEGEGVAEVFAVGVRSMQGAKVCCPSHRCTKDGVTPTLYSMVF